MGTYKDAYAYLENRAKANGWVFYDIVEECYEYDNGLLLIGYADEESLKGYTDYPNVLGYECINLDDYTEKEKE